MIGALENPSPDPTPRVDQEDQQDPPAPFATLRAEGAPLRGRVPPIDFLDNPQGINHEQPLTSDHQPA